MPRSTRRTSAGSPTRCAASPHQTQFIVITHNRGTIEAADALYGVTVGDDSVSRVISLRLDEAQALAARDRGDGRGRVGFDDALLAPPPRRTARRPRSTSRSTRHWSTPMWEPDPADFGVLDDGTPVEPDRRPPIHSCRSSPSRRRCLSIDIPAPRPARAARRAGLGRVRIASATAAAESRRRARPSTHGLERTRGSFMSRLRAFLGTGDRRGPSWDEVEETLIAGDVGAALAIDLVERARRSARRGGPEAAIRAELAALLVPRDLDWSPRSAAPGGPAVVLVVGVNGTGKTTTIGKLAGRYAAEGRRVLLAAADTFRAAAIDQLRIWADRAEVPIVAHAPGADPGPSSTTRSMRPSPAAPTSSSPIPPAASTPSRT